MPLRSFANFKLRMSLIGRSWAGPQKARGPRPWPIWPMRKSVTAGEGGGAELRQLDTTGVDAAKTQLELVEFQ